MADDKMKEEVSEFLTEGLKIMKELAENEESFDKLEPGLYKKFKKLSSDVQKSILAFLFVNSIERKKPEKDDLNPEV